MKYLKPLQLFMELRKPSSAKCLVVGLTFTPRRVSMAIISGDNPNAECLGTHPRQTEHIVEQLSLTPTFNDKVQLNGKEALWGIIVAKKHVGAPTDKLIDDLCKMEKFKSLKYTYWVDNIISENSEFASKIVQEDWWFKRKEPKKFFFGFLMLQQYMDFWNTMVERQKEDFICRLSDSEDSAYEQEG